MNFCGKCGTKVDKDMSFCPFCGSALETPDSLDITTVNATKTVENAPVTETVFPADSVEPIPDIEVENPVSDIKSDSAVIPLNTQSRTPTDDKPESRTDTGLTYITIPEDKSSAGASASGIIAFILGLISLSSVISSFMLTIDVYKQLSISTHHFAVTASSAVPGVIAIILSQKAIDNGYKCGISKAAEITGAIGAFCHVGTLFILLLGIFI